MDKTRTQENNKKLYGIQTLRALCCLSVMLAHSAAYAEIGFGLVVGESLSYWGRYGMLNIVHFFFAISGFFMASAIANTNEGPYLFLKKRLLRIYPTYWCAMIASVLLYLFVDHALAVDAEFGYTFLLMPFWTPYILRVEWTLLYELMFYILAAVYSLKKSRKYYPVFLAVWFVGIFAYTCHKGIGSGIAFSFPEMLLDERNFSFIAGSVAYYVFRKYANQINLNNILCGLVGLGCVLIFIANVQYFSSSLLGTIINYIILIPALLFFAKLNVNHKNFLVKIGDYSYGIYLIHA